MNFIALRKTLHTFPEVSNHEVETAQRVQAWLGDDFGSPAIIELDGTGFAAVYGSGEPGDRIVLRCELDALPIAEVNEFEHRSLNDGVGHKCGHDGHMAILLEVAHWLNHSRPVAGEVVLLFQSAEETGDGALEALHSKNFSSIVPDYIYALHNIPGRPSGEIMIRDGAFTPGVRSLIVKFHGKTSHAAEPEKGLNPDRAIGRAIKLAEEMTVPDPESDAFFLVTTIHIVLGDTAYGISAGYGELHLTLRAWDEQLLQKLSEAYLNCVTSVSESEGLRIEHEWCFEFQANVNHPEPAEVVRSSARKLGVPLYEMPHPFKFGEDFGVFTQKFKGVMFGLGAGVTTPALHNPDYDFPDDIRPVGAKMFIEILKNHLPFV